MRTFVTLIFFMVIRVRKDKCFFTILQRHNIYHFNYRTILLKNRSKYLYQCSDNSIYRTDNMYFRININLLIYLLINFLMINFR